MPDLFRLDPDPAGELGDGTEYVEGAPPRVSQVEWLFDYVPDDELLYRHPVYLVSRSLGERLDAAGVSGYELRDAELSKSDNWEDMEDPDTDVPDFRWLEVTGRPGEEDLGLDERARLVVTQRGLDALRQGRLDACEVEPWG